MTIIIIMKNPAISLIIPVHNEEKILQENLKKISNYLNSLGKEFEIILIENGSTDGTFALATGISKKDSRVRAISITQKSLGDALRNGILNAKGEILVWYPIDMSVNLGYIKESLGMIDDYDFVIGSKEHKNSKVDRSLSRKIYSMVYNFLVNLLFNLHISDTQCVKTFKKESIAEIAKETTTGGIVFEVELLYRARKNRLKIKEVPVMVRDVRKDSKIDFMDMEKAFIDLISLRLRI